MQVQERISYRMDLKVTILTKKCNDFIPSGSILVNKLGHTTVFLVSEVHSSLAFSFGDIAVTFKFVSIGSHSVIPEMLTELRKGLSLIWMSFQKGLFAGSFVCPNGCNSSFNEPIIFISRYI